MFVNEAKQKLPYSIVSATNNDAHVESHGKTYSPPERSAMILQKLKTDADYRANQTAAQRRWRERHPAYWRDYRQRHPDATARNREQQRERNRRRRMAGTGPSPPAIANMDAYTPERPVRSGTYRLVPVAAPGVAKMDAYLVEMQVLSAG